MSLRVCYFGTYRAGYSRNRIMIEGLRRNGVEVVECHESLWRGIEDRIEVASGGWARPKFIGRLIRVYGRLLRKYRQIGNYDVMVLGYPGQLDAPLARLLTWLQRKPLVLDVFMSIYLIAELRGLTKRSLISARLIRGLEWLACLLPNLLILDTEDYATWFQENYGIDPARFRLVPTGADDRVFRPLALSKGENSLFRVIHYGTFVSTHGVETIVEAARLLQDDPEIHFELIGEGPDKARAEVLAKAYGLTNITFIGWMDQEALVHKIAEADVCLGTFGTTPQSLMTIQNKIYEGMAAAKPIITGDGPAVRRQMIHGEHLYLCDRANPASLAEAVRMLKADPELRRRLAERGHQIYQERYALEHIGKQFATHLQEVVNSNRV